MSLNKSQALNDAKQYELQQNVPTAVETYQKIVEVDPTDLNAINALGDLYANDGRVQEAITQFSRAAAGYAQGGFTRKAITTLKKIITIDPGNIETEIKMADLYAQAGLPSEARNHYLQIAEKLIRKGQTIEALGVYSRVVDLDPLSTSTRIKLGELCLREGMNEQAYAAFMTAADQLSSKGENRRALNAYNEALSIKPDSVKALTAARKLMILLGVADPDRSLRSPASQSDSGDLARVKPSSAGSDRARQSTAAPQPTESSFVVQEISKAEILVAYGKVTQALGMLRNVLRNQPDSIETHIKLKDIYLRTGMMAEAAAECRELERIHQARGDSERARDYAVRASRLTQLLEQPSGDLDKPAPKKPEQSEPRISAAPLRVASPEAAEIKLRPTVRTLEAPAVQPNRMTISVVHAEAPPVEVATPAADPPPVSHVEPVATSPVLVEAIPINELPRENAVALVTRAPVDVAQRIRPALVASPFLVEKKRVRLNAAAIAAGVFVLLAGGALIGGFAYNAHLDNQYQTLSLAAAPLAAPATPPATEPGESQQEPVQADQPIMVVVTPAVQNDSPTRREAPEPEPIKNQPAPVPQPALDPPKVTKPPSPAPPRVAVGADGRAGSENRTPVGVPGEVPIGATDPAEPPPRLIRQSAGVVPGTAVKRVDPVYPTAARQSGQFGAVNVEVTINEQGNVTSARALSGPPMLRTAAVMAARAWKFKASTLGGVPVPTTTMIVFNFKL